MVAVSARRDAAVVSRAWRSSGAGMLEVSFSTVLGPGNAPLCDECLITLTCMT
jgi:hypothetical protein